MIKLDKDEKILLEIRKHWFILLTETFFLLFLAAIPFVLFTGVSLTHVLRFITVEGSGTSIFVALSCIWLLFVWLTFFVIWTDYYLDILIITSKKVIDIEQKGLFYRDVSTFRLDKIQDITVKVSGLIPTMLHFGNLYIQTASEEQSFAAIGIPHPDRIKWQIQDAQNNEVDALREMWMKGR